MSAIRAKALLEAAEIAKLFVEEYTAKRDDHLRADPGGMAGLVRARQAQACQEVERAIRALIHA